jgi:hypothetical protein
LKSLEEGKRKELETIFFETIQVPTTKGKKWNLGEFKTTLKKI